MSPLPTTMRTTPTYLNGSSADRNWALRSADVIHNAFGTRMPGHRSAVCPGGPGFCHQSNHGVHNAGKITRLQQHLQCSFAVQTISLVPTRFSCLVLRGSLLTRGGQDPLVTGHEVCDHGLHGRAGTPKLSRTSPSNNEHPPLTNAPCGRSSCF